MKIIERKLDIEPYELKLLEKYLPANHYAVFDIETTGLSPSFSSIILSGFVLVKDGVATLIQYFAETPAQESEVLEATIRLLSGVSFVVTYNGKYFDIPFVIRRCQRYGLEFTEPFDLDMYVLVKYYSPIGKILPKLRQKDLEAYAGLSELREDLIGGGDSVTMYDTYQNTRSKDLQDKILLHNSDDVEQLFRLMNLLKNCDLDRAFTRSGFPISIGLITNVSRKGQDLIIKGFSHTPTEYIGFPSSENPLLIYAHKSDGSFEITAPCETKERSVYVDLLPFCEEDEFDKLKSCAGFVNNYLILTEDGSPRHEEINALARFLATKTLKEIQ